MTMRREGENEMRNKPVVNSVVQFLFSVFFNRAALSNLICVQHVTITRSLWSLNFFDSESITQAHCF